MKKPTAFIPARRESTRLPDKPLLLINDKPMILHVVEQCINSNAFDEVYVCSDSEEILNLVSKSGFLTVKTGNADTGTDRVAQAAKILNKDLIINVQGDEPLMPIEIMKEMSNKLRDTNPNEEIIWNAHTFCSIAESSDPNIVKVITRYDQRALYFSRLALSNILANSKFRSHKQMGIYGYTRSTLEKFTSLGRSILEEVDKVELMRWIDYGYPVNMIYSDKSSFSVDTIEDINYVEKIMNSIKK